MRRFFQAYQKRHLWLLADLALLAAFLLARHQKAWMNALADHVTTPLKTALGRLWGAVPFSVMEVLYTLAVEVAIGYILWSVISVVRTRGHRGRRAYGAALGAACTALTVYLAFCLLWGVNYWTDSFQDRSGIHGEAVSLEELTAVTAWFADRLIETADAVPRDGNGLFAVSTEDILADYAMVYDEAEALFPFLEFESQPPKAMFYSKFMSAMNFTGVYCPFTGETNLNVDAPACLLPATVAHELAHQRSIASEQECNFLAILAFTTCGDPVYAYSGWLMGYIHLGNALYAADREAWRAVRDSLPEAVLADLADNNAYWAQYKGAAAAAGQKVYDTVLRAYGEADGIRSYGTVVDLLTVYYRDAALEA